MGKTCKLHTGRPRLGIDHRTFLANHCTAHETSFSPQLPVYTPTVYTVSQLQVFINLWQNALASQVITFDKFQWHQLLFFSMKTNYRLFDLWPLSLLMSLLMSLPPFTRSSFLISHRLTMQREVMEKKKWRGGGGGLGGFSKSTQAAPTGITSSFFPFPSLPPLSICLSLFILHFFPPVTSPF